ncbi:MAG TPA: SET domain-containing protein-lysine N-methyltransferase [Streptosporangiaceae bacterium]|nr:SET domain-containing protein-lysine N-methyltransferase [Streptosporangiaceae bacterium]
MGDLASEEQSGSWFEHVRLTMLAPEETWLSPKIEVRTSPVHGRGTFAVAEIAVAETVEVWGQRCQGVFTVEYTEDEARADLAAKRGMVVMQWDDHLFSIERPGGDPGYFINHSCDSALWFRDAFTLEARRLVLPGDELTLDYALLESDDSYRPAWTCHCGAAGCRSSVTGRDWMRSDLQSRYLGGFTPLLNKRIAALSAG